MHILVNLFLKAKVNHISVISCLFPPYVRSGIMAVGALDAQLKRY